MLNIQPHQERMLVERDELGKKLKGLSDYLGSDSFYKLGSDDQCLLRMQHSAMLQYHAILHQRILKFSLIEPS